MDAEWQHQLRIYLPEDLAGVARIDPGAPALRPLADVLGAHRATLVSQLDAFEAYVAEAEREGPERYPLYRWTKATLRDPAKRLKHKGVRAARLGSGGLPSGDSRRARGRAAAPPGRRPRRAPAPARYQSGEQPGGPGRVPLVALRAGGPHGRGGAVSGSRAPPRVGRLGHAHRSNASGGRRRASRAAADPTTAISRDGPRNRESIRLLRELTHGIQHDHRDLAFGLALVVGVGRPELQRPFP